MKGTFEFKNNKLILELDINRLSPNIEVKDTNGKQGYLTPKRVSRYTGLKISSVYTYMSRGTIKSKYISGRKLISLKEMNKYIDTHRKAV